MSQKEVRLDVPPMVCRGVVLSVEYYNNSLVWLFLYAMEAAGVGLHHTEFELKGLQIFARNACRAPGARSKPAMTLHRTAHGLISLAAIINGKTGHRWLLVFPYPLLVRC